VEPQKEVWLNGVRFPIEGPVVWKRVTPFPDRFSTSPPTEADYGPTIKQRWGSLKGGMGKEKWDSKSNDRYWYAEGIDASQEAQVLSPLVTTLGSFGATVVKLVKFQGKIWAIGPSKIAYWTGSSWTTANPTAPLANPTDALVYYGAS